MRIYFDSNIFRKLKSTSNQFRSDVFDAVELLRPHFIFPFSEAHMNDLATSSEEHRNIDLKLMKDYVQDNYIHRDHIAKVIKYSLADPLTAFDSFDFSASESFLDDPSSAFKDLFDFEGGEQLGEIFSKLLDLPVFDPIQIETDKLPAEYRQLAERFKDVRTIGDALKKMSGIGDLINDKNVLSKNRNLFSGYVNRDDYSFDNWSFEFDQRMQDTVFGKSFTEMVALMTAEADRNDEYTNFINTYTSLEFLGVTEERTGAKLKLKKNSFMDIQRDAAHAFFASKSDFFVTDDLGVQQKAFIAYRLFSIRTEVLSIQDFLNRTSSLLLNEGDQKWLNKRISLSIRDGKLIHSSPENKLELRSIPLPIFNYFNRLQINSHNKYPEFLLLRNCNKNTAVLYSEVNLLIHKCAILFGEPAPLKDFDPNKHVKDYTVGQLIRVWIFREMVATISWESRDDNRQVIVLSLLPLPKRNWFNRFLSRISNLIMITFSRISSMFFRNRKVD